MGLCDASNALVGGEGGKGGKGQAGSGLNHVRLLLARGRGRIEDNKRQPLSFIRAILVGQPRTQQLLHSRRPSRSDDARVSRHPHSPRHPRLCVYSHPPRPVQLQLLFLDPV